MAEPNLQDQAFRDRAETMRRLEGIVASAMDGIITVNDAQQVVLFNPAAEIMFGVQAVDVLGQPIARFIPERYRGAHGDHIRRFTEAGITNRRMGALGAINGVRANGEEFPIEASISHVEVGDAKLATVILRDISERKAMEDARQLLAREVDHRAKNALAVVQALVSLTTAATQAEFIAAVRGRVSALGRAHSLLAQNRWEGASLTKVIADETAPYHRPGQLRFRGPPVVLGANAVQPVSLLIHELATNALKYGALSAETGLVEVEAQVMPNGGLSLSWVESGGPPVSEPRTKGFGSTLIAQVATRQLGGSIVIQWPQSGMRLMASLPPEAFRPEAPGGAGALQSAQTPAAVLARGARVLVVEDEALLALELGAGLAALGWEVLGPASSTDEALRLLAGTPQVEVAVLDINLAGKLVYPLADELLSRGVPVVFCTGYEEVDARYRDNPVVRKPVSVDHLSQELHRLGRAA